MRSKLLLGIYLLSFSLFSLTATTANAGDIYTTVPGAGAIRVGLGNFSHGGGLDQKTVDYYRSIQPGRIIETFPSDRPDTAFVGYYAGSGTMSDGRPIFYFESIQEVKRSDLSRIERISPTQDGMGGGLRLRDQKELPEGSNPAPGLLGTETSGAGASAPGEASVSGAGVSGGTSGGSRLGNALEGAAGAGLEAGIGAGIVNGILIPPGTRRALEAQGAALAEAARRAEAQERGLRNDANNASIALAQEFAGLAEAAAKMPALPSPAASQVLGEFGAREADASAASPLEQDISRLRTRQASAAYAGPREKELGSISSQATGAAADAVRAGDSESAKLYLHVAETFLDVALGFNPVTAFVSDGYGFLSGRNFVTGEELSGFERTLAGAGFVAGLATMGAGSSLVKGAAVAGKLLTRYVPHAAPIVGELGHLARYTGDLGLRTAEGWKDFVRYTRRTLGNEIGAVGNVAQLIDRQKAHLGKWAKRFHIQRIIGADELNAKIIARNPRYTAPYKPGTQVVEFALKEDEVFFRLHNAGNKRGAWVMRGEAIDRSLTPAELRIKYSLPVTPEFVSELTVKKGTYMRRSVVNSAFGGGEGAIQYELLGHPDRLDWLSIGKTRPIGTPAP